MSNDPVHLELGQVALRQDQRSILITSVVRAQPEAEIDDFTGMSFIDAEDSRE
jgi:hypothetical protein